MLTPEEQSAFDAAMQEVTAGLEQEDGPKQMMAPNDKPYVLVRNWTVDEGAYPEVHHMTLAAAIEAWTKNFKAYVGDKRKVIWRIRPEADCAANLFKLDYFSDPEKAPARPVYKRLTQYKIYSRLMAI